MEITNLLIIFIMAIFIALLKNLKFKKPNSKKKKKSTSYKEKKEKGNKFERFVGKKFEDKGYTVAYHGLDNGKKDQGIDIIAKKDNEIVFIQCKNWENGKYKINTDKIKSFIGDTYTYMEKNPMFKNYKIKRIYAITNPILTKKAESFCKYNPNLIEVKKFNIEKDQNE